MIRLSCVLASSCDLDCYMKKWGVTQFSYDDTEEESLVKLLNLIRTIERKVDALQNLVNSIDSRLYPPDGISADDLSR